MGQTVEEGCPPAFQGIAIDSFLVTRAIWPAPQEQTTPVARQGPDGGLM
jgi:hypothetical protein